MDDEDSEEYKINYFKLIFKSFFFKYTLQIVN